MKATWKRKTVLYLLVLLVSLFFSYEAWGEEPPYGGWELDYVYGIEQEHGLSPGYEYIDRLINNANPYQRSWRVRLRRQFSEADWGSTRTQRPDTFSVVDGDRIYRPDPNRPLSKIYRWPTYRELQDATGKARTFKLPKRRLGDDTPLPPAFFPGSPFQPPGQSGDPPAPGPRLQLPTFGQPAPQTLPGWPGGGAPPQAIFPGSGAPSQPFMSKGTDTILVPLPGGGIRVEAPVTPIRPPATRPPVVLQPLPGGGFGEALPAPFFPPHNNNGFARLPGRLDCRNYPYLSAVGARNLALAPLAVTAIGVALMTGGYVTVEGATVLYTVTEATTVTASQAVVPALQGAGRWALTTLSPGQATWRWLAATTVAAGCDAANRPLTTAPITTPLGFPLPGAVRPDRVRLYPGPTRSSPQVNPFSK